MKNITLALLAHVDAGKTTLTESLLFQAQAIRKRGRVDHQDAFLDYEQMERKRGITIYAKQAGFDVGEAHIDLIDTPGHVDFSAEMERSLSVLDLSVVLISALDGIQSHTRTIWKCLNHYRIPSILFVNKMDAARLDKETILRQMEQQFQAPCIDMHAEDLNDQLALISDEIMNHYMETGIIDRKMLQKAFEDRQFFPVYFGSALKDENVDQLLEGILEFAPENKWPDSFGARVFKITHDERGVKEAHLRITGGTLHAKEQIDAASKADQIRLYSGSSYRTVTEADAGRIVVVTGLDKAVPGMGLGFETDLEKPVLEPSLSYQLLLPDEADPVTIMGYCKVLSLEDPSLQVEYEEESKTIFLHLMGAVQMEILQEKLYELSGFRIGFGPGQVVFKETIAEEVNGYGHFEPLRHYAEVHLHLTPGKPGSGMVYTLNCPRDMLSLNWQRQIINALMQSEPRGVLGGYPLTDVQVTITAGRVHPKHTEGGDLRQAAFRALRQGLMKTESILLEPFCRFELLVPSESISRALFDLDQKKAQIQSEPLGDGTMKISGRGPVRLLMNYQQEVQAYTRGQGSFTSRFDGYDKCLDAKEILEARAYDPLRDRRHPAGSVFCAQGSGYFVEWDEVEDNLHIPVERSSSSEFVMNASRVSEEELRAVFARSGSNNENQKKKAAAQFARKKKNTAQKKDLDLSRTTLNINPSLPECLIVDGYNMIYSWPNLRSVSVSDLSAAREELISLLINYQGYKGCSLMIVFDGYQRAGNPGSTSTRGSASIVYTAAGQSADQWIEKKVHDLKGKFRCVTATSDALIQNSVLASGSLRISARELERRVMSVNAHAMKDLQELQNSGRS